MTTAIEQLRHHMPAVDFWSIRLVDEGLQEITVRKNVLEPVKNKSSLGAMITIFNQGGCGYAATSDLSAEGLAGATRRAQDWASTTAAHKLIDMRQIEMPAHQAKYQSQVAQAWSEHSLASKIDLLKSLSVALKRDDRLVDWMAVLWHTEVKSSYWSSNGSNIEQHFSYVLPWLSATAHKEGDTQTRTLGAHGVAQQGGFEIVTQFNLLEQARRIADESIELLLAPNCPSEKMDVLLDADQMMLQIHESIGHPLELDRILGDERNYAGTSFVTQDMFGTYQYGSPLLNITFDPTVQNELASYGYDDDGSQATRTFIIQNGILMRPLGSNLSQQRAKMEGVANSRACSWNRPPIDRMANLNLEPGKSALKDMIAAIDHGVYMRSNSSWSIDDSRNKFQFGCEWARMIQNGKLTHVVRNPNYRGVSAHFWRSLKDVGNRDTLGVFGTPFCGKGEPNQCVRVGHASPACTFADVDVFGGV